MAAVDLDALASELAERLAKGLHAALRRLLKLFDLRLTPELAGKLREAFAHVLHVVLHELVHPLAQEALPWLGELLGTDRVFVEELLARMVERTISLELRELLGEEAVLVESFEEQLAELEGYEQLRGLKMDTDDLSLLFSAFLAQADRSGWARDFAKYLLELKGRFLPGEDER